MATTTEGIFTAPDGHELYTLTATPSAPPVARLVFLHGFSDTTNQHAFLFRHLATQHSIKVYAFDQRGWGRSVHAPKQKGLSGGTQQVMDDITHFIHSLPADEAEIPLFLMGHSMGGGEVLYYASAAGGPAEVRSKIRGFVAEAPWIAVHEDTRPYAATVVVGRALGKLFPHRQMVQKLDSSKLCRDVEVCKAWERDEECHDTGTLEGLAGALDRGAALEKGSVVVKDGIGEGGKTRLLVAFGTADKVVSYNVARKWFDGTGVEDKEFRAYEGWYHNLDMEPGEDKVKFADDVGKWVVERSGSLEEGSGRAKL